jgi:hypothetical protein
MKKLCTKSSRMEVILQDINPSHKRDPQVYKLKKPQVHTKYEGYYFAITQRLTHW